LLKLPFGGHQGFFFPGFCEVDGGIGNHPQEGLAKFGYS
jgi:hypothetical protein